MLKKIIDDRNGYSKFQFQLLKFDWLLTAIVVGFIIAAPTNCMDVCMNTWVVGGTYRVLGLYSLTPT